MTFRRAAFLAVACAGGLLALSACSAGSGAVAPAGSTPATSAAGAPAGSASAAATAAAGGPATKPHVTDVKAGAEPECRSGGLTVTMGVADSSSGHRGQTIVFRNNGSSACFLRGYPGVAALGADGKQVAQAERTSAGYEGGLRAGKPPKVRLAAGAAASARVEALAARDDGGSCTPYAGLLVTPPDETHSVKLAWDTDACTSLEVHPVVAGSTGQG